RCFVRILRNSADKRGPMTWRRTVPAAAILLTIWGFTWTRAQSRATRGPDPAISDHAAKLLEEGRRVFRYETFGDEAYWGDTLKLHRAIAGEKNGGVGPGLSPKAALGLGLKVDAEAVPA